MGPEEWGEPPSDIECDCDPADDPNCSCGYWHEHEDEMCAEIDCNDSSMAQDPCCMPSGGDDGDDQCDAIDCNDSSFAQDPCCMPSGGEEDDCCYCDPVGDPNCMCEPMDNGPECDSSAPPPPTG